MTGSGTFFARAEWRRRWRAHLGIAAIVAVVVAAVLATLVAASRSERAFTRLREATRAAEIAVFAEPDDLADVQREIAGVDGVAAVSSEAQPFVRPAGEDLFPDYNLLTRAPLDDRDGARVNTPVIVEGRAVDPNRADEVVLSEQLAGRLGVSVGDALVLESMTDQWVDTTYNGGDAGDPDGPPIRTTVVGLARSPADFDRWAGTIHLSPAFVSEYRDAMRMYGHVEIRLGGDGTLSPGVESSLRKVVDGEEAGFSAFANSDATSDGLSTIARALRIVAVVAAIAGAVVIVLAVSRLARATFREHSALRALGWTRRQFLSASVIAFLPAILVGVVAGLAIGTVFAPRALVGLAGRVDPEPHQVLVDGRALWIVGAGALILGVVAAAASSRWSQRREERRTRPMPRLLRLDRPVPVVLGARRAIAGESELGGRTSRGAAVVLALAVAGAIAALVVSASIERLQTDPLLSGQGTPDGRSVDSGESLEVYRSAFAHLKSDPRIAALSGLHIAFGARTGGEQITTLIVDRVRGSVGASMVAGRVPDAANEIALGPRTADRLGKHVGDRVRVDFDGETASYRLVGEVLFPEGDFQPSDDGAAMTMSAAARLMGNAEEASGVHTIEYEWKDGVKAHRADHELEDAGYTVFSGEDAAALFPARVTNLGEVEQVPRYLAVFLGVLALITLGHALATSARRRSHETATLRALGLTGRAGAGIVATQAATTLVVALVVGVPIGLLLGDRIWTAIAEGAHVVVETIPPQPAIGAFVGAVVVSAALAAVGPAWRTARLRPGEALRAE